jgi:hypothetical protein
MVSRSRSLTPLPPSTIFPITLCLPSSCVARGRLMFYSGDDVLEAFDEEEASETSLMT